MSEPTELDLARLRRSCAQCSLQQLCLPAGIGAQELAKLDEIVQKRRPLRIGDRLFRFGDALSSVFVARDGAFKTVTLTEAGEEHVVGFHVPGDLIGLDALGSGVHRCEAIALTPATVCEVPFDDLTRVASQLPALHQQMIRIMGQSTDRDQDHMEMLVRRQASERIALFLHGLGERLGHIGRSSTELSLPMSRLDIASFLGLALETVSRGFTRLQDDGVIQVVGRQVRVLNVAELTRLSHANEALSPPPAKSKGQGT